VCFTMRGEAERYTEGGKKWKRRTSAPKRGDDGLKMIDWAVSEGLEGSVDQPLVSSSTYKSKPFSAIELSPS